jgi:poly(3-hydroxyalkanoate) synthetase
VLQTPQPLDSAAFRELEARFRDWYEWTVDLPGTYYLEVVERLFKENELATGRFVALGKKIDLGEVSCPIFLLAAQDDELVAPEQILATEHLVGSPARHVRKLIAPCDHLGLFMGRMILTETWPRIARWLAVPITSDGKHARPHRAPARLKQFRAFAA